jgi:hypothetical protein
MKTRVKRKVIIFERINLPVLISGMLGGLLIIEFDVRLS